jgi:hypothetical protein
MVYLRPVSAITRLGWLGQSKCLAAGGTNSLPVRFASCTQFYHRMGTLNMSYTRFGLMIAVSTVVMFGLMYLNTFSVDHVFYSQTRMWMALLMGAVMAIVMIAFMWSMYPNRTVNAAIVVVAAVVFCLSLWLIRSQETVDDVSYMKAMIPHHSIAIMTSSRAHIKDPRVRKLADGIIAAQVREIEEMKQLIADLQANPVADSSPDLQPTVPTQ